MELVTVGILLVIIVMVMFFATAFKSAVLKKQEEELYKLRLEFYKETKDFQLSSKQTTYDLNTLAFSMFYQAEFIKGRIIQTIETMDSNIEADKIKQLEINLKALTGYTDAIKRSFLSGEVKSPYIKYEVFQKGLGDNCYFSNN